MLLQNNKDLQTSSQLIFDFMKGQIILNAISTVINLKIPDYLKDGPKSIGQLAEKTNTHPDSLYRLLRMLSSVGIFTKIKKEISEEKEESKNIKFGLTPMAALLQSSEQNLFKSFSLLLGRPAFKQSIDDLQYAIQTGQNSFKHINNLNIFEYLQQNPVDAQIFNEAMAAMTSSQTQTISSLYDFSQFNNVVDIGGGQGLFLSTILKNNPNLKGIVFDLPYAIEEAKQQQRQNTQSSSSDTNNNSIIFSRYKYIAGDFFKSIPSGADGYIIKNVILNWDDESVSIILKNCLQAMEFSIKNYQKDNGRQKVKPKLIIIDAVMPEDDGPSIGNLLDIMMLVLTMNGRIRNKREYIKLLKSCGFEVANIIHPPSSSFSPSPMNFLTIIEAIPHSIDNRL